MKSKWIWIAPLAMLAMLALVAFGGWVVMLLWNWLLPPLFGWRALTFWQALGMLVLCRILVGGFAGRGFSGYSFRRRMAERWERRMAERWDHMTPEERERFRRGLRERWGFGPPAGEGNER
jgi:hypothetical protein